MSSPAHETPDAIRPIRQRRIPQPVSQSPTNTASPTGLRSASTPAPSAIPRITPGQKKSVRDLAAGFEVRNKDNNGTPPPPPPSTRPAMGSRSASATNSSLPRPKTPSSRPSDQLRSPSESQPSPSKSFPSTVSHYNSAPSARKFSASKGRGANEQRTYDLSDSMLEPRVAGYASPDSSEQRLYGEIDPTEGTQTLGHGIPHVVKRTGSDGSIPRTQASPTMPFAPLASFGSQATEFSNSLNGPHQRSRSDNSKSEMTAVAAAQQPMDFAALPEVLQPDVMQDIMNKRQQTRIPAPTNGVRKRTTDEASRSNGVIRRNGDDRHRPTTPPSPMSFSPLESFSKSPEKRLKASIREPSPKKSPPLRSSRPRQRVSAVHGAGTKSSFGSVSPERPIPGAFRDSFLEPSQESPIIPEIRHDGPAESFSGHDQAKMASEGVPNLLTQLSSAVYQKQDRPKLTVDPGPAPNERAHTPGSVTEFEETGTDFEEDTPLSATKPDFPHNSGSHNDDEVQASENDQGWSEERDGYHEGHRDSVTTRHALGLTVQTNHMEHRPPPQFIPHRPTEVSPALSQDADNAGTIDIVLDDPFLRFAPKVSTTKSPDTGQSTRPQDEQMSPMVNERGFLVPRRVSNTYEGRINVDDDGYNTYNNIIDSYQQSGSLSPDMIEQFQQHILVSGDRIPMQQFEQHVHREALTRQDSQHLYGVEPSPLRVERINKQELNIPEPRVNFNPTFDDVNANIEPVEMPVPSRSAPPSTQIGSEEDTASTATPLPHRISAQTVHSTISEQPSLPEIQDTGGGLGLLNPDVPQSQTLLGVERVGNLSRSTDSSLASQQHYARSIDSQQATSGQQEGPETPPTSISRPQSFRSTELSSRQPSVDQNGALSSESALLTSRQRVIQELIDTEFGYYQDMTVLHDIYFETAPSCAEISNREVALIFGNTAEMVKLAREYADRLKEATRDVYVRSRKSSKPHGTDRDSNISTSSDSRVEPSREVNLEEADRLSTIGAATIEFLPRMEKAFGEYLRNADNANSTMQRLKDIDGVKSWLQECYDHAKDLTEAWNLDALMIKPTQRITRYPLLLTELRRFTPEDHPDRKTIDAARDGVIAINQRINQSKKQSDLIKNATSYEPKRNNLFKPILNWTDKTRQKMGKVEGFEDVEYNEVLSKFSTEAHKVNFVLRDFQNQLVSNDGLIKAFTDFTRVLETLIDIKPCPQAELESKWRRYVVIVRELLAVGYPDHVSQVHRSCIQPLRTLLERYKAAEATTKKRKERLPDYVRYRGAKERGDKIDKKLSEAGEEFEALNEILKSQLPQLRSKTKSLVDACLYNFAVLTGRWYEFWQRKIMPVLEDEKWRQPFAEYVRHHKEDWGHLERYVDTITARNKQLLQGTADFFATSESARSGSLASRHSPGYGTPNNAHRGSASSVPPSMPGSTRPSNESGRQYSSSTLHQRSRSRSQGQQVSSKPAPPLPPVPSHSMPTIPHNSSFLLNQTPPASNQEASSYLAASNSASRYQPQQRPSSSNSTPANRPLRPSENQFARSTRSPPSATGRGIFQSALPMSDSPTEPRIERSIHDKNTNNDYQVLFLAASLFEFNIDPSREESGFPYLTYVPGEIFDVIGTKGELWLARNQDDSSKTIGWIWEKHFAKLLGEDEYYRMADEQED